MQDISLNGSVKIGNKKPEIFSLADLEDFPEYTGPRINYDEYSTDKNKFSIGFASCLGLLLDCNHVYNQYIYLDDTKKIVRDLEKKVNTLHSFSKGSRFNSITRDGVNDFLNEFTADHRRPVRAHYNIMAWPDSGTDRKEVRNKVSTAIAKMDASPRVELVAGAQLYWAGIPGNQAELPINDTVLTFMDQAICFLNNETNYRDSKSPIGMKLGERLSGKPIHIDISDEPWEKGIINNRNKFILGPSGSGKSFFMNKMMSSYYDDGSHIVLVDVGYSYQGLCEKLGGYFFAYEEDNPIQFNPFFVESGDILDTEKKESLKSLLLSLWKKDAGNHTRSEYVGLSGSLKMYFEHLKTHPGLFACFDTYYEFTGNQYKAHLEKDKVREKEFDILNYLYNLKPFYKGGEFDYLLNAKENLNLMEQRFIVFELDNIKDHPILFPVVTLMIMEIFIAKMRKLKGVRKIIAIEEAWKAIAKEGMAEYIKYLFKTVRKFYGEAMVVTQDVEDILSSPIVKKAIINNSDCKILLDQSKSSTSIDQVAELLGLTDKEAQMVLSINKNNDPSLKYREVAILLGGVLSRVYRTEVSLEEYLIFTTEKSEKEKLFEYVDEAEGSYDIGLRNLAKDIRLGHTSL
ncbi:MAG TPA: TraG family conjugative transposon ATPase [Leeuwenhoekiella sp.]|nr:TraG family conjugative transposon ATPase [Leeuwenhoekiella sp.]